MLTTLRIKNLAIIEELELDLSKGMNVITGETGAGKSVLLKGLALLTGDRGSNELIRHGAERCEVEGVFEVSSETVNRIAQEFDWFAEAAADGELVVRRALDANGRGKVYINGRLGTRGELEHLAPYLLDITGQHQQRILLEASEHRRLLDQFGVDEALLARVRESYHRYHEAEKRYSEFSKQSSAKAEYFRRLGFERDELKEAALRPGEKEECNEELKRHGSSEQLAQVVSSALVILDDESDGLVRKSRELQQILDQAVRVDGRISEILTMVKEAAIQLQETSYSLGEYGSKIETDPEKIEALRSRIAEIAKLERRYGKNEAELIEYESAIRQELSDYESGSLSEDKLRAARDEALAQLRKLEGELTAARTQAAAKLTTEIQRELPAVDMKRAKFSVSVTAGESSSHGADLVEFELTANPGQPPRSLRKVASGGELSRVILLLKTALNDRQGALVQVFDEVDTGIGGAVAQTVGEKIKSLTPSYQVLLVTHAPQIAALADRHFNISKEVSKGNTRTRSTVLDGTDRVSEIARMLAGKKVSASFEESARELLAHGGPKNRGK